MPTMHRAARRAGRAAALVLAAAALAAAGCLPAAGPSVPVAERTLAAGNLNNLCVVTYDAAGRAFHYWQRDAADLWHPSVQGRDLPAAVAAWRENLLVFFASGRYGLFGAGRPVIHPAPATAWMPVAACEDGLAADAFGWNAAGDPIHARFEDGQWAARRAEVGVEREKMLDPCAVRFGGRLFLVWREEVPTLTGPAADWRVRFAYQDKDRWFGPVASRLRVAAAPRVAADAARMVCLYQKPAPEGEAPRWTLATYATADEDWHETAALSGAVPAGPLALARQGGRFFVVASEKGRPALASLDVETGSVGPGVAIPAPVSPGRRDVDPWMVALVALVVAAGALVLARHVRARVAAAPVTTAGGAALVPAPFGRRGVAVLLDYLLVAAVVVPALWHLRPDLPGRLVEGERMDVNDLLLMEGLRIPLVLAYFTVCEALWGRTLGKRLLGIEVRGAADGGRIGWRQALVRNLLRIVDEAPGMYVLGLVSIMMGPWPQRLGDRAARTLVVLGGGGDRPPGGA